MTAPLRRDRRPANNAKRRRQAKAQASIEGAEWVGMNVAWCQGEPADVDEAKQRSHDTLIAMMGNRRRGGVTWHIFGDPDAQPFIDSLKADTEFGTEEFEVYRRISALLREYGGKVVVATAPGVQR